MYFYVDYMLLLLLLLVVVVGVVVVVVVVVSLLLNLYSAQHMLTPWGASQQNSHHTQFVIGCIDVISSPK